MCAVGEKLIRLPENCGVVDYFVRPRDETQEYDYPEIVVRFSSEFFANPEFIANFNAWLPTWLEFHGGIWFIVKAPGVENWCAECNVMQARPCFQFRCAACDNTQWSKDVIEHAWYSWHTEVINARCEKQGGKNDVSVASCYEWFKSLEYTSD